MHIRVVVSIMIVMLLSVNGQTQSPKPVPDADSIPANKADLPRIKADTKGNIVKKEGKTTQQPTAKTKQDTVTTKQPTAKAKQDTVTTKSGLKYIDTKVGTGSAAAPGKMVEVQYVGWFYDKGILGKKFVSSIESGQAFKFLLGRGMSIKGWEEGIAGMKVGGKRTLIIKPELAYGAQGFRDMIPPNMGLVYEITLLAVTEPERSH